ncbi:alpha/beta hydrolase fold domain-containing protein [Roseomonas eburnea]|uniref:Alpha/beta hydrolase fold domain-containing protein n=1 Tax=Neoroseomonas eburnea TaxID=1346889 RepID=A0A9X9XHD9_9PROT|nr:alpha/beta hydrolase [Neoroseomonas eburnea]MBR0683125.1 alpha/beta hydrolase fold domain-containing protein [Neoroseomonas eburnea]
MDAEAEYNNRARVPDSAAIIARWMRDAATFRTTWASKRLDVRYGDTEPERLDLFLPEAGGPCPLALFIHGGYWQALDRTSVSHFARGLLLRGVAVAVPSYGLCPAVPLATIVEQMRRAAAVLCMTTRQRMLAVGHSAGGQLSALLQATDWPGFAQGLPTGIVPAALPISGVFELEPLLPTSIARALNLTPEAAHALSPRWLPPPGGELHTVVGGAESPEFLRQTRDFAAAWGGTAEEIPLANHFTVLDPLTDPDHPLSARAADMARRLASL